MLVTQAHADVERSDKHTLYSLHDLRLLLELMNFHLVFSFVRRKKKKYLCLGETTGSVEW